MTDTTRPFMQTVGNYDLLEKIAEGGMGTVYKGRDRSSGAVVAIKIVPPHISKNSTLLKRFQQEYKTASSLDHPNIVRAMEFGFQGASPYLVMEFVEGESLGQKIEREGAMAESEAIRLIAQVAQGLHKAHKAGLVHRDVKPDNILVTPDGQAKLTDLGLVKELETDLNLTRTGRGLGTPHFMAPEQFREAKTADSRADIYSLAATLYMMVTGELPFKSCGPLDAWMKKIHNELTPPRQVVTGLSERIDWAIRRAMSADKNQRPQTCREFVEDLTGHSTRKMSTADAQTVQDYWFLVYKDDDGVTHTVKGSLVGIRRSLKEGMLGDASNVRASKNKTGPFEPLRQYPEFRDLVVTPQPLKDVPGNKSKALQQTTPETGRKTPVGEEPPKPRTASGALGPHIRLSDNEPSGDWLRWVGLFLVALVAGVVGYFVLPLITGGPVR
jgi:eukaryotic-like serine/threonine-protein kinase